MLPTTSPQSHDATWLAELQPLGKLEFETALEHTTRHVPTAALTTTTDA
jgi:hypothetical protein